VSSANRAGTLVSVCSVLISLSLDIRKAHISSDGGWFLDGAREK
jgi:UTP:GlnB (protein PII) uridylyltransferase